EWESFVRGRGSDLHRIREYMPEDSARHVDWKATAKSGSLKVREFSREDERKLCIVFDNPAPGVLRDAEYERGVALAASVAWHFSEQDAELSFLLPGRPRTLDLHEYLAGLAVIQPGEVKATDAAETAAGATTAPQGASSRDPLQEISRSNRGEYHIVLTARSRESLPLALWNSSYFVFLGNDGAARTQSQ
ncbi:MAG: DUF58 domain-containing protein, partial [Candidatus Sulfotelmatobacter sp.]